MVYLLHRAVLEQKVGVKGKYFDVKLFRNFVGIGSIYFCEKEGDLKPSFFVGQTNFMNYHLVSHESDGKVPRRIRLRSSMGRLGNKVNSCKALGGPTFKSSLGNWARRLWKRDIVRGFADILL